jgi:hypothetical protein
MASSKVQGSKLAKDRQAALLALADSVGDAKAAARFGIRSPTTVRNYRRALTTDGELRSLYEAAKARQDAVDDRVVEAEAEAVRAVWAAVRRSADMLGRENKPATPQYLEALAKLIEAAGKNSDNRAELEMSRRLLEGGSNGRRTPENPAAPAPGGSVPEVRPGDAAGTGAVH